jgi:hypothetical protein
MGRRRVTKKTFPCGHRGLGQLCRRCLEAARLRYFANSGKKFATNKKKKNKNPEIVWTKEKLLAEADRLEEEGRKVL